MSHRLRLPVIAAVWLCPSFADATYSITALDRETGELGGAGASCVPYSVDLIYGAVAAQGALNSQAFFDADLKAQALSLLAAGASAGSVLSAVTNLDLYPEAAKTQWGIVDLRGGFASFTGPGAQAFASDLGRVSSDFRFVFTVQGNLLTSSRVVEQAALAFEGGGCDLADRLVRGLEAAGSAGEGDRRCTPEGRPAKSAFLDVTRPDGSSVHIGIPDVSPEDPVVALRASYDAYRMDQTCPPEGAADGALAPAPSPTKVQRSQASSCSTSRPGALGAVQALGALAWLALGSAALGLVRRLRLGR